MSGTRISSLLGKITVLVVICCCCLPAQAEYGGGTGEPNDPYLIYDANQMNAIGADSNDWDKHFILMADIDLSSFTGTEFNIIGYYKSSSNNKPFTGVFDGNDHTISNFTYDSNGVNYIGLFGYVYGYNAEIKDLGLIAPDVDAGTGNLVGSLVGQLYSGTLTNCYSTGSVSGLEWYTGGLVGLNGRSGTITNCYVEGVSVSGDYYVGGLVGGNWGTVSNCYSTGDVSGDVGVGGLVGYTNGIVSNCYSTGSVSGTGENIGGLVGESWYGTITNCYSTNSVSGSLFVGGLVGLNDDSSVSNCYSTGDVNGNEYVGGLVGWNLDTITNSYSAGSVSGSRYWVGGLVGYHNSGVYTSSFWDNTVNPTLTGIGNTPDPNVIGESTVNMQTESTFTDAGWDFVGEFQNGPSDEWAQPPGGGYMLLWWQLSPLPALPSFSGGTGTGDDPYLISSPEDLNRIGHNSRLMGAHFKLINDIDLSSIDFFIISSRPFPFTGIFDGNSYTISNFTYESTSTDNIGLFRYVDDPNAEIKNLGLIDPDVDAGTGNLVGSLVGWLRDGTISNCYVEGGSVAGNEYVGSLVGYNSYGTISDCYANGSVMGTEDVGGLVGANSDTISNCYSTGSASGTTDVGSLAGYNGDTISDCHSAGSVSGANDVGGLVGFNDDTITNCYAAAGVLGNNFVGGLVGGQGGYALTSNSYSTGAITGTSTIGGLIGVSSGRIYSCYARGGVSGDDTVGGLVGRSSQGNISKCYAAASVAGDSDVGGLMGYGNNVSYTKCFWDIDINPDVNGIGSTTDPNVIGESTANMQTESTFTNAGWDFVGEIINGTEDIWAICEGVDYPKLAWQFIIGDFDGDDDVDFTDFAMLAARWLGTDNSFWCAGGGTDLTNDGNVDFYDLKAFADNWLSGF